MQVTIESFVKETLGLTDEAVVQSVLPVAEIQTVRKNEIILREGQTPERLSFLWSGAFRGYFLSRTGKDATDCFCCRLGDPLVGSIPFHAPAQITMQAIRASEIFSVPMQTALALIEHAPAAQQLHDRLMYQSINLHAEVRQILASMDAAEKYRWFVSRYPELDEDVPLRFIASFLDVSAVTLSRVRSEVRAARGIPV